MSPSGLADLMRRIGAYGVLRSAMIAKQVGIAPTDLECLDLLHLDGPLTPSDLIARTGLSSGAVTAMCDRLARRGFVIRERHPYDGRKAVVQMARPALEAIGPFFAGAEDRWAVLTEDFTQSEQAVIERFLVAALEQARSLTTSDRSMDHDHHNAGE